jgi:hypothetical protein
LLKSLRSNPNPNSDCFFSCPYSSVIRKDATNALVHGRRAVFKNDGHHRELGRHRKRGWVLVGVDEGLADIWIEQAYRLQLLKIAVHLASVDRDRNDALAVLCLRFDAAANQLSHGRHRLRVI